MEPSFAKRNGETERSANNLLSLKSMMHKIGPGILFAATSIGTSHLVQATRAGADYGLAMLGIILFACFIKYPAFRFGSDYSAATGYTLIDSYFRQGRWKVAVYSLDLMVTIFIATAAISLICAGLINFVLSLDISVRLTACTLLALCAVVLIGGRYHLFEKITKWLVAIFMLVIVIAVSVSLPNLELTNVSILPPANLEISTILFMVALAGWMPSPVGASVFQSVWVCAKNQDLGQPQTATEARYDFNFGYIIASAVAVGFLLLGTVLMFQPEVAVAESSTGFAEQLIGMFSDSIGQAAYPIIAAAIVAVMLSTLLAVADACPRIVGDLFAHLGVNAAQYDKPGIETKTEKSTAYKDRFYTPFVIVQCLGAMIVLLFFMTSFKVFIDFATSVAFLTAPLLAFMNHRAMYSPEVPELSRPSRLMKIWSLAGIVFMGAFCLCYIYYVFWV